MPRARNIKPTFFTNEDLVELPMSTRLLFIGLWTLADREGRLEDRPKRIMMNIFPADMVDVDAALDELTAAGFLERYVIEDKRYIQIINFHKHQHPHHRERESTIPPVGGWPEPQAETPAQTDGSASPEPSSRNAARVIQAWPEPRSSSTESVPPPRPALGEPEASPRQGTASSSASPSDSHDSHDSHDSRDSRDSRDCGQSGYSRPIPRDFNLTDYRRAYLKRHAGHLDPEREFEEFCNHHEAKGSRFKNWDAAWRTWCSRSAKYNPPPNRAPARKEL